MAHAGIHAAAPYGLDALLQAQPLYMDKSYRLTYDDSGVPSHYGWKQPARFAEIEKAFQLVKEGNHAARTRPPRNCGKTFSGPTPAKWPPGFNSIIPPTVESP